MRKRLLLFLVCLASVLLAGYGTLWLTAPKWANFDNFLELKEGITLEEVETVLGAKGLNPSQRSFYFSEGFSGTGAELAKKWKGSKEWMGEEASIFVCFDDNGRLAHWHPGVIPETNQSFLTKLRRWLGIQ